MNAMNTSLGSFVLRLDYGALPPCENDDCHKQHDPGWLLCHGNNDDMSKQIRNELLGDSLQTQCLRALAKYLPLYVQECGVETMHEECMSLFPPSTLSALSIECSRQGTMTESIAYIIGHHDFVDRLTVIMPPSNKDKIDLPYILQPCLRRLELGHMHLEKKVLNEILTHYCPSLTHLSIRHCTLDDHDDVLNAMSDTIRVLDLSDNDWVTDEWLLDFWRRTNMPSIYCMSMWQGVDSFPHNFSYDSTLTFVERQRL